MRANKESRGITPIIRNLGDLAAVSEGEKPTVNVE
jgi:hypothetical protein